MSGTTLPLSAVQVPNAWQTIENDFGNIKGYALLVQQGTASGGAASASAVLNLLNSIVQLNANWAAYQADTSVWNALVAYVQNLYANTGVTTTIIQGVYNAAQALATAIETDYPHDAASPPHLLDRVWTGTQVQYITLTAAQLPNTMTAITAYLATLS